MLWVERLAEGELLGVPQPEVAAHVDARVEGLQAEVNRAVDVPSQRFLFQILKDHLALKIWLNM